MKRQAFLKAMALLPLTTASTMKLKELNKITGRLANAEKMPALFLGHGSPMNAIGS